MSTLLKHLNESLLDDEEELVADDKYIVTELKNKIISFIENYYVLLTRTKRTLNFGNYLKINDDYSVDIKSSKSPSQIYTLKLKHYNYQNPLDVLPVENFTWGSVPELYINCINIKSLPILPKHCDSLYLDNCNKLTNVDLSDLDINKNIRINNGPNLKEIKLNSKCNIENFNVYWMNELKSITGFPNNIHDSIVLYDCPKLNKVSPTNTLSLYCKNCTSLSETELNKINSKINNIL